MMNTKILLITLSLIYSILNGQQLGGSAAFLKKGMSARALGMGSAYVVMYHHFIGILLV